MDNGTITREGFRNAVGPKKDKTIQGLTNLSNLTYDDLLVAWDSTEADENNRTKKISPDVMSKYVGVAGQNSAIITSNSKDVSITMAGKQANDGMILCLTFTQAITGQSADTMTLSFNGEEAKTIKVAKNGVLANFTPFNVLGTYTFLGAYTNLLLQRDEADNCYLIVGNPQVYKNNNYTIYANGRNIYYIEIEYVSSKQIKVTTPINITFNMDGRKDDGAFSLVTEVSLSQGTTTLSTYSERNIGDYRRIEATAFFNNFAYSSESMYFYFNSPSKKIVICIQTF